MTTYIHKIKCLECGIHYVAYSWKEEWNPQFCPECGAREGRNLHWRSQTSQQVFEFVPGKSPLVGIDISDRS